MDDIKDLTELNLHFIESCRQGSWEMLTWECQFTSTEVAYGVTSTDVTEAYE